MRSSHPPEPVAPADAAPPSDEPPAAKRRTRRDTASPTRLATTLRRQLGRHLRQVFQLDALRPGQQQVIDRVLAGQSTLAIMPTGAGKSLCYQLPAMLLPGCTLVISPLIALMKDQCEKLRAHGVCAVEFNSTLDAQTRTQAEAALVDGSARIVLVTPERLADPQFMALMQARAVSLAVVDEAHCISEWGHDFRPAFLQIGAALKALGQPPVLALTATAPPDTAAEIARQLRIPRGGIVDAGIWRPNLHYSVEVVTHADDKPRRLLEILQRVDEPGIVYTSTVRVAEQVHAALLAQGVAAGLYHGKLRTAERNAAQEAFMSGATRVIVATNAFGMGIDKADVRFVVHYQLPPSLDAYYQESGRAGRDGQPAHCVLLYLRSDRSVQQFFLGGHAFTQDELERVLAALHDQETTTLAQVQERARMPRGQAAALLAALQQAGHCRKSRPTEGPAGWRVSAPARNRRSLLQVVQAEHLRRSEQRRKLEAMVDYAESGACRWKALALHLQDEADAQGCGTCDNCCRMRRLAADNVAVPAMKVVTGDGALPLSSLPAFPTGLHPAPQPLAA